jgi:antitoxin CcdA
MRMDDYDVRAPKKAAKLSINADLLARARDHDINLSSTLERALADALRQKSRERWLSDNKKAIAAYNEQVDERGTYGDDVRSF